ncbi:MAG: hypothetical protein R3190_08535 [Thermoanaerobaculia bacterium]|nr:hypothetical protein [Thermoanaerobaculia bacterium]
MKETLRALRLLRSLRRARSRAEIEALQRRRLDAALQAAWSDVPFYQRVWARHGVDLDRGSRPARVEDLPVIESSEVRDAIRSRELLSRAVDPADCRPFSTTGSSGEALTTLRSAPETRLWRATALRFRLEHGARWRQKALQLHRRPHRPHLLQRLGVWRSIWVRPELEPDEQAARVLAGAPASVIGTPTVVRRLAHAVEAIGRRPESLDSVFCVGECIDPGTVALIARVFGVPPVFLYGMTEVGYVAWQCERRAGFHVNADVFRVELLADGRPARPGELGRIVVTDLYGRTMPLIRCDTGDLAVAARGDCGCGRELPLLASIEGRATSTLEAADGTWVTARQVAAGLFEVAGVDDYRLHQGASGRIELTLRDDGQGRGASPSRRSEIRTRLRRMLGGRTITDRYGDPHSDARRIKTHAVWRDAGVLPA